MTILAHRRNPIFLWGLLILAVLLLAQAASAEVLTDEGSNYATLIYKQYPAMILNLYRDLELIRFKSGRVYILCILKPILSVALL